MISFSGAYCLNNKKEKVYKSEVLKDEFVLPETAKDYTDYIDEFYAAADTLSPDAVIYGVNKIKKAMTDDILNAKDVLSVSGRTYYISNFGNDAYDGLSPETAWATVNKLNAESEHLQKDDAVLFERGGEWRKQNEWKIMSANSDSWEMLSLFIAKPGVSYGAYGKGNKPVLNGSERNYAKPELWHKTGINNVYICTEPFYNTGVVALDYSGIPGNYNEKLAKKKIVGLLSFKGLSDLCEDCSYYLDTEGHKLYFCSEHGNPGERFKSIEIGGRVSLIRNEGASVIDNLRFRFDGYGIIGGPCLNVKNCIFEYIGGCQLNLQKQSDVVCGNAIEIYGECDGVRVENCWIYQICDTAVTNQLWTVENKCLQRNIAFSGNVIEYCHWSVEFNNPPASDGSKRCIENCTHSYNIMSMGGYGWGDDQFARRETATLYNCFGTDECVNCVCEKNILNISTGPLYRMRLEGDKKIRYKDNINIQFESSLFAYLYDGDYLYDSQSEERIKQAANYESGKYIYLENNH